MGTLKMGKKKKMQWDMFGRTMLSPTVGTDMTKSREMYAEQNAENKKTMEEKAKNHGKPKV